VGSLNDVAGLAPPASTAGATVLYGVVTAVSPLAVKVGADTQSTAGIAATVACAVDDRVVMLLAGNVLIIIGVVGGSASCPYGVGDCLVTANSTVPSTRWPGTAWVAIEDKFLLGASTAYPVSTTGGEATHTLSVAEMPSHNHGYYDYWNLYDTTGSGTRLAASYNTGGNGTGVGTMPAGGGAAHNNMPPWAARYIWQRTA
jgi:hypothetical protein